MAQIHKRFTTEQIQALLKGYCQGILDRPAIEQTLGISKSRFFVLLREYRHNPDEFSLAYHRETPTRIPAWVEKEIEKELDVEFQRWIDWYNTHHVNRDIGVVPRSRLQPSVTRPLHHGLNLDNVFCRSITWLPLK